MNWYGEATTKRNNLILDRRGLLSLAGAGAVSASLSTCLGSVCLQTPTEFQLACMTLPYSQFPLHRALEGIQKAGFRYVAWGTTHRESGSESVPVLTVDATLDQARELSKRCRDMGLEPLMMFSTIYPEHDNALSILTHRLQQASAAGVPQLLTFGHTQGGNRQLWIDRFKQLGPIARDLGVLLVAKQHGGETGTGQACAQITREVNDSSIKINYDAGNVMDYLNVDPIPDIHQCADEIRSLCLKDHRNWPKDEDCAPGFGEIDHYRLLDAVADTGRRMPLCFENISYPLLSKPSTADDVDERARRARLYIETIIAGLTGLQTAAPKS